MQATLSNICVFQNSNKIILKQTKLSTKSLIYCNVNVNGLTQSKNYVN